MGRASTLLALGLLLGAAACVSLSGLSSEEGSTDAPSDAGPEAFAADALPPPDPCRHASPPAEPAGDDDPIAEVPPFVLAVREASVKSFVDGGAPLGYDLDGVCSCFADPTTARGGQPSCAPTAGGGAACDGDGGIDNALGGLVAAYPDFLGSSSASGGPTLLVKVSKYNGRANDREVFVAVLPSAGIYDPEGCGAGADAGAPPYSPTWAGCDRWTVDPGAVLPGTTEPSTFFPAYVVDHVLVMRATPKPISFLVGTTIFPLTGTRVSARLVALDDALVPLQPQPAVGTRFGLVDGVIAGRASTRDMLRTLAASLANTDGGPLCGNNNFFTAVKTQFLCPGADVTSALTSDFTQAGCDAVSVASSFAAAPAQLGQVRAVDKPRCDDPTAAKYDALFDCTK